MTAKTIHAILEAAPAWVKILEKNYSGDVKTSPAPNGGDVKTSTGGDAKTSPTPPPGDVKTSTQGDVKTSTLKQPRKTKLESKNQIEKVQTAASGEESPSQNSFSKQEGSAEGNLKGKIKTQIYTEENRTDDAVKAWEKYSAIKAELTGKDLGLIKDIVQRMGDYNSLFRTPAFVLRYVCQNWAAFWTFAHQKEMAWPKCNYPTLSFVHKYLTSAIHFTPEDKTMAIIIADIGHQPTSNFEGLTGEAYWEARNVWDLWLEAYWAHPLTGDPPPDEEEAA